MADSISKEATLQFPLLFPGNQLVYPEVSRGCTHPRSRCGRRLSDNCRKASRSFLSSQQWGGRGLKRTPDDRRVLVFKWSVFHPARASDVPEQRRPSGGSATLRSLTWVWCQDEGLGSCHLSSHGFKITLSQPFFTPISSNALLHCCGTSFHSRYSLPDPGFCFGAAGCFLLCVSSWDHVHGYVFLPEFIVSVVPGFPIERTHTHNTSHY